MAIPSEDECYQIALDAFRVQPQFQNADLSDDGFLGGFARALVSSTYSTLVAYDQGLKDAIPQDGSSFEALSLWAVLLGLSNGTNPGAAPYGPLVPQKASGGKALLSGAPFTVFADGSTLADPTGQVIAVLVGTVTLDGAGTPTQAIFAAATAGPSGNLPAGTPLTWQALPLGAPPTITLTNGLTGGSIGETADNQAPLLARILFRLQNPPGSGRASDFRTWTEAATDATGAAISNIRSHVYPLRQGEGTVAAVPLLPGSGTSRIPSPAQIAAIKKAGDAKRPRCSRLYVLTATVNAGRLLSIRVRADPAAQKYAWDWTGLSSGGYQVTAFASPTLTFSGSITIIAAELKAAVDAYKAHTRLPPQIQVASTGAGAPVVPISVRVVDYADLGATSTLTLQTPLPSTFVAPLAGDSFYPGGPIAVAAQNLQVYVDNLGPARGKYADPDDPWSDTVLNTRLVEIVNTTLDTDGSRMANVRFHSAFVAVGAGASAEQDVQALDVGLTPEVLALKLCVVTP